MMELAIWSRARARKKTTTTYLSFSTWSSEY
jgi:hypothetical protein